MIQPTEKPMVKLSDNEGNAFSILGRVKRALQEAGADKEYIEQYMEEATYGDYDHLIQVTMRYVGVY